MIGQKLQSQSSQRSFHVTFARRHQTKVCLRMWMVVGLESPDRCSTSGRTAWMKDAGRWCLVWFTSSSSQESELVACVNGRYKTAGLLSQWMLVQPTIVFSGDAAEPWHIIGITSTVAIGILKMKSCSRRARHVEVKSFFA